MDEFRNSHLDASDGDNPFALSIGDLMAALLLIFVLLLSATLLILHQQNQEYEELQEDVAEYLTAYDALRDSLYQELRSEFSDSLTAWNATLDRQTLSIRFGDPEVLFLQGSSVVRARFRAILRYFIPRYIGILRKLKFRDNIREIRIEGHTSPEWQLGMSEESSYFLNMALSQERTRAVLQEMLSMFADSSATTRSWMRTYITANGLSSSQPIGESADSSRRVEFRVRTNAEDQLVQIRRLYDESESRRLLDGDR